MQRKTTGVLGLLALMMVLLLAACGESHEAMLRQLEALEQMNRADSVMTNDSLAEALTDYFDSHGTANERMRTHYILGRTYADMGEAPAAINAYLDAADCADTTATDCDYHTLSRVYSQMADVFYWQNLMEDYIKACDKSIDYAWRDRDTMQVLNEEALKITAYNRLEEYDKVIAAFEDVYEKLLQMYGIKTAAKYCILAIDALIETGNTDKAKYYIDILETESGYFDTNGNIEKGREVCYFSIGMYYLLTHQTDSAKFFFSKELHTGLDTDNQQMASHGLSLVHQQENRLDSAIYYALYSYNMLDSVFAQKSTDEVERMSAAYQYNRFQKQAIESEKKADRERLRLYMLLIVAFLLALAGITAFILFKKRKLKAIHQLTGALTVSRAEQQNVKLELEKLKSKNYDELIIEKERKEQELELRIVSLEREIGQSERPKPQNRFADFKNSQIVNVFGKKAHFTKDHPVPNKSEWNTLVGQFREDMPATYQFFFDGKKLSPLELYTCILLILDFEEGAIVGLTQTSNAAVSNAKSRANQKLFNEKSAVTLKYNLKSIV